MNIMKQTIIAFKKYLIVGLILTVIGSLGTAYATFICPMPRAKTVGLVYHHKRYFIKSCNVFKKFLMREYRSGCKVSTQEKGMLCSSRKVIVGCDPLAGIVLDYRYCNKRR